MHPKPSFWRGGFMIMQLQYVCCWPRRHWRMGHRTDDLLHTHNAAFTSNRMYSEPFLPSHPGQLRQETSMQLDQTSPTQDEGQRSGGVIVSCSSARLAISKKRFMLAISNDQATSQFYICSFLYIIQYYLSLLPLHPTLTQP